jgi:hypothetical protein
MENTAQTNARVQHLASFMQRATSYIEEAKKHEREENFDSAIKNYTNALELFEIIQKNEDTHKANELSTQIDHVKFRLAQLEGVKELNADLLAPLSDLPNTPGSDANVSFQVVYECHGVQCFLIESFNEGNQIKRTDLAPNAHLVILKQANGSLGILKVEGVMDYPLTSQVPCLSNGPGRYTFALPLQNTFLGITITTDQNIQLFESIVSDLCVFKKVAATDVMDNKNVEIRALSKTEKVVNAIEVGGGVVARGIQSGASYLKSWIEQGGKYLTSNIAPNTEPSKVPEGVKTGVHVVSKISPVAVQISAAAVEGLGYIATKVGGAILSSLPAPDNEGSVAMNSMAQVGKASISAVVNVWDSLLVAGESIFDATSATTTEVVHKKYGEEASEFSKKSFGVASDVYKTANNFGNMGVKALARHAVKHYFVRQQNGVMKEVSADQAPKYMVESQL